MSYAQRLGLDMSLASITTPALLSVLETACAGMGIVQVASNTFRFNDTLQGSAPVYFTLTPFNRGNLNDPLGMYVQVGSAIDSNGNIIGQYSPTVDMDAQGYSGNLQDCYFSGDVNRFHAAIADGPDIQSGLFINIERTKSLTGADTSEGIIFQACSNIFNGANPIVNMVIPFSGTVAGHNTTLIVAANTLTKSMAVGTKIGTLDIVPFNFRPYNPGYGLMVYYGSDYPLYSNQPIVKTDGNTHNYIPLQQSKNNGYFYPNINGHILMRYE